MKGIVKELSEKRNEILDSFIKTFLLAHADDEEGLLELMKKIVLHEKPDNKDPLSMSMKYWVSFDRPQQFGDWIACKDRMPDIGKTVVCWNECNLCRGKVKHAHNCVAKGFPDHGTFACKLVKINGLVKWNVPYEPNVTHWQPFPEGPQN